MIGAQLTFVESVKAWSEKVWDLSAPTIRGLSLTRPCPFAFTNGPIDKQKRIENRKWSPPAKIVGRFLALHASQTWSDKYFRWIGETMGLSIPSKSESPESIIFAVCRLVGYTTTIEDPRILSEQRQWFLGPYAWLLDSLTVLSKPVECVGGQRLWRLDSRPGVLDNLRDAYLASSPIRG
jgi:hypothetical protein